MGSHEQFELVRLRNGAAAIRDLAVGELCHPSIGPAAEARVLYVDQLHLRKRLADIDGEPVVWDVGLGGAANALTVLRETRGSNTDVRLLSFDRSLEALLFAVQHAEELGYFDTYTQISCDLLDAHEVIFRDESRSVHWTYHQGDFPTQLASGALDSLPAPHAILFDAYSPKRNPDMWTRELFSNLFSRLDPNRPCQLATYSRSTMLRVSLLLAGFFVGIGRASGRKEETTVASNDLAMLDEPLGKQWLERATRSSSAEPLESSIYEQRPLSISSRSQLLRHSQFS
jgi:hypothetical protein